MTEKTPCPACPVEVRGLYAAASNAVGAVERGEWDRVPHLFAELKGAVASMTPLVEKHFEDPAHSGVGRSKEMNTYSYRFSVALWGKPYEAHWHNGSLTITPTGAAAGGISLIQVRVGTITNAKLFMQKLGMDTWDVTVTT